jgi:hypothetical protein
MGIRKSVVAGLILCLVAMLLTATPALAGALTSVTDTLGNHTASATTTHTVAFTTANNIPKDGKIVVTFPSGFNISGATLGTITGPNGSFALSVAAQIATITRSGTGSDYPPGAVTVPLSNIVNTATAGSYYVTVKTTEKENGTVDGPTNSANFTVVSSNNVPTIDYVKLYDTGGTPAEVSAMTPQVEYDARVKVTDADGLADLTTIVVKVWYDADGGTPTSGEFSAISAGDAQTAIIMTWTEGGTFVLTEESGSTWALGTGVAPVDLTGYFQFKFIVGKVATETTDSANWQIAAKVTDDSSQTAFAYDTDTETNDMNWYGEITVPTATVNWGTVNPGMAFGEGAPSEKALGVTVKYISNGAYDEKVKSGTTWAGAPSGTATLATDGTPEAAQEFALKADDTGTLASAVVVDATGVAIDESGTQTAEAGDSAADNALWLKLASTFSKATYSGTITYIIAHGS